MVIKGELCLDQNDDYTIFSGGRLVNLSDYLKMLLLEEVHMKISRVYNGQTILDTSGKLYKNKVQPKYYLYHIGDVDIDSILWNLVGSKIKIELKNISKE